jgi:hypothetical protein
MERWIDRGDVWRWGNSVLYVYGVVTFLCFRMGAVMDEYTGNRER